ncbi:unnamed protein product [Adineta steineri]|uniref:Cyclic nucleotide-binding domain-containing protein n=1 Tax=Adineta steineri TaxID=433720 RepID=A0A813Y9F1_9BILA|nr:unnamed protein product [Adineta steineri]CAF3494502.1 unnamed protein product [Adineta steineri]
MSGTSNAQSLPNNIESNQMDSSSMNNPISQMKNHFIQLTNENNIQDNIQENIKLSKISNKNGKFKKNEMETIIDENCGEKCMKTSESICDVSSEVIGAVYPSSSSYSPTPSSLALHRSDKQQRSISISDPRASLQAFPDRTYTSKNSYSRRSTTISVPPTLREQYYKNNKIILHVPYQQINKKQSHDEIILIKKTNSNSNTIDETKENVFYSNSDSDSQKYHEQNSTKIKLSLPINSSGKYSRSYYKRGTITSSGTSEGGGGCISGEFILPTNPPITVTIEPQKSNSNHFEECQSFHDDQICSPESASIREQRSSIDPSIKGGSTVVNYFMDLLKPSDNKLAMKLFGSRKGLLKERLRQQRAGHCIIHPCSNFRFYWDLIMLVLLITNVIVLPVAIAFFSDEINSARWIILNVISDAFFLFDIVVNFRTGILANDFVDEIILEPRLIAKNYIKTWFIVDLLSSLPVDYLFLFFDSGDHSGGYTIARTGRAIKVLRLVKLLSLLRLLRLSRLVRYIHQWEEFLSIASMVMRILNLLALIILLAHWNGCLQFMIPMFQNFPTDCWVALNGLQTAPWTEQYTVALFKALSHMLCIGYGRYPPQSYVDMWLTMLSMITGAMCYAITIGHVSALVQSFDTSRRLYNEKFKQVEEYMAWRKLPREMRNKISDYYEHRYQGKIFHEDTILTELSERLRLDVINYNCRSLVSSVPFFTNADPNFVSDVVTKLRFEVFQPGDQIIYEGTIGDKMYFIQEGIVDIIKSDGTVLTTLSDGSYFGEICLLTRAKRVAGVRCVTYCNLYSLDATQFESVLESYPLMRRTMESVAAERLNKLGKNPSIISTRHDLKRDAAVLKDIIKRATPLPSSNESTDSDNDDPNNHTDSSSSSNQNPNQHNNKQYDFKSSLRHLQEHFNKSNDHFQNLNEKKKSKRKRRKSSTSEQKFKKLSRLFLAAPSPSTLSPTSGDQHLNQLRKSPSTPWSLFRKSGSPTPSLTNQPHS